MSAIGQLGESAEDALQHAINAALQAYSIDYKSTYINETLQLAIVKTLTGGTDGVYACPDKVYVFCKHSLDQDSS